MATLFYTIFGITAGASLHCAVRREISPCTCAPHESFPNTIQVTCERMESFSQVVDALQDRFVPESTIWLKITHSELDDLGSRTFAEMNMNLKNLRLNFDNLSNLPVSTFRGLSRTEFLSLSDNNLEEIPSEIFDHMPNIGTLDFARGRIKTIRTHDFKALPKLKHLVLAANQISKLETDPFPSTMVNLHVGKNNLTSLNGTIRNLTNLKLLFINSNELTTLEDELPPKSPYLLMILAQFNKIEYLPSGFRNLPNLESLYFHDNRLKTLGGNLRHASKLTRLFISNNAIEYLAEDEFQDAELIDDIQIAHNYIRNINGSLQPIRLLRVANFSCNLIDEFSLKEIANLRYLRILDLSHNRIQRIIGMGENQIESHSFITELDLKHNLLYSLDGALMGLNKLRILKLSNNKLQRISPDDFIGLEELEVLDISNNQITTLEETSKTFLPSLSILNVSYNILTSLTRDFHGLPVLCLADFSNNMIMQISPELVARTRCTNHGVPNKLEIILQENPVLCDDDLPVLITAMELQQARLLGVAHCIVPQTVQHPTVPKIIQTQIPINNPNPVMLPPPSIVQVIVPVPIQPPILPQPEARVQLQPGEEEESNEQRTTPFSILPLPALIMSSHTQISQPPESESDEAVADNVQYINDEAGVASYVTTDNPAVVVSSEEIVVPDESGNSVISAEKVDNIEDNDENDDNKLTSNAIELPEHNEQPDEPPVVIEQVADQAREEIVNEKEDELLSSDDVTTDGPEEEPPEKIPEDHTRINE